MSKSAVPKQSLLLLIAVALGGLMDGLDGSIINIALPVIAADFGTDTGSVSWTVIIYLLMVAGTILIFGNIAGRGHVKKTLIIGFGTFTIASLLCGLSVSLPMLIAARLVQGLGAAMIIACAPIVCVKFMPSNILGLSFGVLTAATSIGFAVGPAIGGILTHYLSWNRIFFINIPIGIFAVLYCLKVVPKGQAENSAQFDWIGAVLLFIVMASGVYVLERLPHFGFTHPQIIGFSILFILSLITLCILEMKTAGGMTWGRIKQGWISLDYVKLDKAPDNTPVNMTVNTDCLRVRSGAGLNNRVVGYLYYGAKVQILETKKVSGMTWARIENGWVSMDYLVS